MVRINAKLCDPTFYYELSKTVEYHSIWPLCLPDLITYLPNSFKVGSSRIYADATNIIFRASDIPDLETQKAWIFG